MAQQPWLPPEDAPTDAARGNQIDVLNVENALCHLGRPALVQLRAIEHSGHLAGPVEKSVGIIDLLQDLLEIQKDFATRPRGSKI